MVESSPHDNVNGASGDGQTLKAPQAVVPATPAVAFPSPGLARLAETARDYAAAKDSANTARAYASD
ncbi:MAG: hypothetical protein ACRC7C_11170, partial [Beijerinckiaceae bacterium]